MDVEKLPASRLSTISIILLYWLPPLIYAAFIFYLSSLPGTTYPYLFFSADKLLHLGEYGILGYLLARALGQYQLKRRVLFMTAVSVCFVYGISDEFHQFFVPNRCSSVVDIIADVIGSSLGIGIYIKQRSIL